ncbi:MAG: excinuclease ABC subunit C, partial [Halobacteriota archaeon]
ANLRDRLEAVEALHGEGGEAVSNRRDERTVDVLGATIEGDSATVARLHAARGQLVDRSRHHLQAPAGEDRIAAVLGAFVPQYYSERDLPDALLLSERPDDPELLSWLDGEGVAMRVPGAGREAKLVELALKNARRGPVRSDELGALGEALGIDRLVRIEGFDVSHAQGSAAVGSDVTFVEGTAEKADYRRKKLTDRNDDYANMRDLVRWRARRAVEGRDSRPDPDLLLIDGGDGQLGAAQDALDEVGWDVPVVALAKEEELVITPNGVHRWPSDASHLHVLQRVRDEAHRFAVQYHQTVRDEVKTVLDDVPGVGPKTRRALFRRFGSVENIRAASVEDLCDVSGVGEKTAQTLVERL